MSTSTKYVLLTGSDLGDRQLNLKKAAKAISNRIGRILRYSSVLETAPWGFDSDTLFLNQALLIESSLTPIEVLEKIHQIETEMGRKRIGEQYISRIIDIDILCAENQIHSTSELTIPHKHLTNRYFALKPLCEIASDWSHPFLRKTYAEILNDLEQKTVSENLV
jgi:2-amino-4-hydroxy-6-hydroxymethyldihydropteridine diphosphokinase